MTSRRKNSYSRDSMQSRSSLAYGREMRSSVGASASKIPRTTPLMQSSRKVLPSASKSISKRSYFSASDHHLIKDPRPVTDKGYIRSCILEIIKKLTEYGYPHTVSYKMMNPPTNKEYFRIVEFVYQLVSPNYSMSAKPEEEMVKILSQLGYPISFSKSTFNNIGAMSAWPNALAALDWLLDWATYYKESEALVEGAIFQGDKKMPALFEYLRATYTAFMHGQNEPFEEINKSLDRKIGEMGKDQIKNNEKLEAKRNKLEDELKDLKADKDSIVQLELEKSRIETVKRSLDNYFQELDHYISQLQERRETINKQMSDIQAEVVRMKNEMGVIESTVLGQEISIIDLQNMQLTISKIEAKIRSTEERTSQAQERFYEKQIQEAKTIDKINSLVAEYMDVCRKLEIVSSAGSGEAQDSDFSLTSDRADVDKNIGKLLRMIRPKAMEMKSSLLREVGKVEQENMRNIDTIKQLEEEIADSKRVVGNLRKQLDSITKEEQEMHEDFQKKGDKENAEIEALQETIKRQKLVNNLSVEDAKEILENEHKRLKETETRIENQEQEDEDAFNRLYEKCNEYKAMMIKLVDDFNEHIMESIKRYMARMELSEAKGEEQNQRFQHILSSLEAFDGQIKEALSMNSIHD